MWACFFRTNRVSLGPPLGKDGKVASKTLLAEHGLSLLLDTRDRDKRYRTLLDTGYNGGTAIHNMEMLSVSPDGIDVLVMSHGHMEQT